MSIDGLAHQPPIFLVLVALLFPVLGHRMRIVQAVQAVRLVADGNFRRRAAEEFAARADVLLRLAVLQAVRRAMHAVVQVVVGFGCGQAVCVFDHRFRGVHGLWLRGYLMGRLVGGLHGLAADDRGHKVAALIDLRLFAVLGADRRRRYVDAGHMVSFGVFVCMAVAWKRCRRTRAAVNRLGNTVRVVAILHGRRRDHFLGRVLQLFHLILQIGDAMLEPLVVLLRLLQLLVVLRWALPHHHHLALAVHIGQLVELLLGLGADHLTIALDDAVTAEQRLAVQHPFHIQPGGVWPRIHAEAADGRLGRVHRQVHAVLEHCEQGILAADRVRFEGFVQTRLQRSNLLDHGQQVELFAAERVLELSLPDSDINVAAPLANTRGKWSVRRKVTKNGKKNVASQLYYA